MTTKRSFFAELQRRNVYKVGAMYAVAGWLVVQIVTQVFPVFHIGEAIQQWIVIAIVAGFPVALVLSWIYELTPQGIAKTDDIAPDASITQRTGEHLNRAIIGILALAVLVLLVKVFWPPAGSAGGADAIANDKSIAVLPFANTSGDAGNEYFSDGLSEELISSLSHLANLRVIGRTSSFQFKGKNDSSKAIGTALGVAYLLEGSVRKSADRVRIAVSLLKAADGVNVWSESYDRDVKDIFAVQTEIADKVAGNLKAALLGGPEQAASARPATQNLDAYTALMQGNYHWQQLSAAGARKAIDYYEQAVHLDPNYGLAYAKLANARILFATTVGVEDAEIPEQLARARGAAAKALQLAPNLSETHQALGALASNADLDIKESLRQYYLALQLSPQDPLALLATGVREGMVGHLEKSLDLGRRAIETDPISNTARYFYSRALITANRLDDAQAELRKSIELAPQSERNYMQLAVIEILRGNGAGALALAQQEPNRFWGTFALALAYFASGDHAHSDAKLQELIDRYAGGSASQVAMVYALRKEPDRMFEWLDRAAAEHDPGVLLLRQDPFLLAYKTDPRYVALGRKLGLPDLAAPP